jgi:uncharacterized protein (TIGR03067 family)
MARNKLKSATFLLVASGLAALGGGLFTDHMAGARPQPPPVGLDRGTGSGAKDKVSLKIETYVDAVRKDLALLQGRWEIVSFEASRQELIFHKPDLGRLARLDPAEFQATAKLFVKGKEYVEPRSLVVEGNRATLRVGRQEIRMTWLIDPTRQPKSLDICYEERLSDGKPDPDPVRGHVGPAIYEVDGDTLKECSDEPGARRPVEYSTARKTNLCVVIYKRIKPRGMKSAATGK